MTSSNADGLDVCVYRSDSRAETYLFLPAEDDFDELSDDLKNQFGSPVKFYRFHLHVQKILAQADPEKVLAAISEQGFYLQLPPPKIPVPRVHD